MKLPNLILTVTYGGCRVKQFALPPEAFHRIIMAMRACTQSYRPSIRSSPSTKLRSSHVVALLLLTFTSHPHVSAKQSGVAALHSRPGAKGKPHFPFRPPSATKTRMWRCYSPLAKLRTFGHIATRQLDRSSRSCHARYPLPNECGHGAGPPQSINIRTSCILAT